VLGTELTRLISVIPANQMSELCKTSAQLQEASRRRLKKEEKSKKNDAFQAIEHAVTLARVFALKHR